MDDLKRHCYTCQHWDKPDAGDTPSNVFWRTCAFWRVAIPSTGYVVLLRRDSAMAAARVTAEIRTPVDHGCAEHVARE